MDFKSIQAQIRKKTRMLVKVQCAAVEGIGNAVEICIKLVLNRNVHTAEIEFSSTSLASLCIHKFARSSKLLWRKSFTNGFFNFSVLFAQQCSYLITY